MAYYLRNGNTYRVTDEIAIDISRELPAGNYIVKLDDFGNFFLEVIDSFNPIAKKYGALENRVDRIFNTFSRREASTGVMLAGEKGSGKSLLAKELCIHAANLGIPTIVINNNWCGDKFNKLIQDIEQPAVILFDEFEKVYSDTSDQEKILTLLDGVFPMKKLFLMTSNDKWRIDQHMRNRPGRIFYMIDFTGLEKEFIEEYCEDCLNEEYVHHTSTIVNLASLFAEFNFDMLKALVEEINRYGETPQEAMKLLNAKPEYDRGGRGSGLVFDVVLMTADRQVISNEWYGPTKYHANPISATSVALELYLDAEEGDFPPELAKIKKESDLVFAQSELVLVDGKTGIFEYQEKRNGYILRLVREVQTVFDYSHLL